MKKIFLLFYFVAVSLFAQTNISSKTEGSHSVQVTPIDGYAARVNNTIITYGKVRENAAAYLRQLPQQPSQELNRQIQQAYIQSRELLIEEALLQEEADTLGLVLPPEVIEKEINQLILERFGNDRALLAQALASRRMTFDEWEKDVASQFTTQVFYSQEVIRYANVSSQAVLDEYEKSKENYVIPLKIKYRFILINKGETDEDHAVKKEQAEKTLQTLRDGADFAVVAKEISEGNTDDIPWRELNDVNKDLRPALCNTSAGQISDLIETDNEYYIIKVEERREEGLIPFEELRDSIHARLLRADQDRLHDELIKRLSAKHFVERY